MHRRRARRSGTCYAGESERRQTRAHLAWQEAPYTPDSEGNDAGMSRHLRGLGYLLAAVVLAASAAGASAGERLDGYWMDSDGEVLLQIGRCGNTRCGRVAWLRKPRGPDGGPLRDFRNPDPRLQSRFVCGLVVVSGFRKQRDGTWGDGTVYVPDHGMSFSGEAQVLGPNHVKVSGYVLLPIFGSSEVWTRVNRQPPTCKEQAKMIAEKRWSEDISKWPVLSSAPSASQPTPPMASR
jgi:uncharacterized protein (DUF2147 family)